MKEFTEMMTKDYGITKNPITVRNPQANSIIERIHQTIGNMIRTFSVHDTYLDKSDPWTGILAAVMFGTQATMHSTARATPVQLVFGRDAMLNIHHEADWKYINERRDKLITANNKAENSKRKQHTYNIGDSVLLKMPTNIKYGMDAYNGPYRVAKVQNNGTLE